MRRAVSVVLTSEQQSALDAIVRAPTSAQRAVKRAQVVLLAAKGWENQRIAKKLKMGINNVAEWRRRFVAEGLDALLHDRPGRGRKPTFDAATVAEIVNKTTATLPPGRTQWSRSSMAKASGVSESTVGRIWRSHGLKPHRIDTFKVSRDPKFAEKLEDVVGLYLAPPANAVVFSADEKSQIQALDRTQPGLPIKKGRAGTMTHDYKRNGTTTLFAALNIVSGAVSATCMPRHTHKEWLKFLKRLDAEVPPDKELHVICDNYATHKHAVVQRWLTKHPRVKVHFTPTSASWLNMVERFFRDLTVNALRRGAFTSVGDLIDAIDVYLLEHNREPKPFIWQASASDILAKVTRAQQALKARIEAQKAGATHGAE
ncbi:MAG: IS630 family transposase [Acidobacteria bacterium]|nr:IS630 family transposase [Acidobacteriota bacterium]